MCTGCSEFLKQKKPVFTRAAMLQVKKRWIEPQDHNDIVQSAYLKALERKAIDPEIVSKPNRYFTRLMDNLTIDELRRRTVTVAFDEHGNPIRRPIVQGGFDDEALLHQEAVAREKYLGEFSTAEARRENTERVNELLEKLHSPEERDLFSSWRDGESAQEFADRHGISREAAKRRRLRFKAKLVKRFRGGRHG